MMRRKNHASWFISILLLIGSVLLFIGGPDYYSSRSFKAFWDLGHILYFALFNILLSRWSIVSRMSLTFQWVTILTITLLVGVTIELLQYGTPRASSAGDVLRDMTGSMLVLVFGPLRTKLKSSRQRFVLQLSVVLLTLVLVWPLAKSLVDETISWYQFPLLSGFETPFEIDRWEAGSALSVESLPSITDGKLLKLLLTTEQYSGVSLKYFNGNWVPARALRISFYNPDSYPLRIVCRIHDQKHIDGYKEYDDRYNRNFLLMPGLSQVEIDLDEVENSPLTRDMDMSRIRGVGLFVVSLPAPRTLYIDEVRLVY